jgi:hypothetical protein
MVTSACATSATAAIATASAVFAGAGPVFQFGGPRFPDGEEPHGGGGEGERDLVAQPGGDAEDEVVFFLDFRKKRPN